MTFLKSTLTIAALIVATPAFAQYRNELATVEQVARDYPGLIQSGHPCGAFVDQVAHRLNRRDGDVRWGRKARNADGTNPNCDAIAYLSEPSDRRRKVLVDIIINGPDPGRDDPNARPAWQEYPGDNVGNGHWTEPITADRDSAPAHEQPSPANPQPEPPATVDDYDATLHRIETQLEALRADVAALTVQEQANTDSVLHEIKAFRDAAGSVVKRLIEYVPTIVGALGFLKK